MPFSLSRCASSRAHARFLLPLLILPVVAVTGVVAAGDAFRPAQPPERAGKPEDIRTVGAAPPVHRPAPEEVAKANALFGRGAAVSPPVPEACLPAAERGANAADEIWRAHPEWKAKPVRMVNTHPRPPGEEGLTPDERDKRGGEER
jgi:hypothetical protein